jgi:hypothetical protein
MSVSKRTVVLSLTLVMASGALARGQSASQLASARRRPVPVVILSTVSNRTTDTLTIRGTGFGRRAAQVWCEDYPLTVASWTDTEIVVYLPDALLDGSYLLTVLRGDGQKDRDVFYMTVQGGSTGGGGAEGTPGPRGDVGPAGPTGDTGPAGPKGDGSSGCCRPAAADRPAGSHGSDGTGRPGGRGRSRRRERV